MNQTGTIKKHPPMCQGACTSYEEMRTYHGRNYKRKETIADICSEINSRIKNLESNVVVIGSIVKSSVAAKVEYKNNKPYYRQMCHFYSQLVRTHLHVFGLIYSEELKVIMKLIDDIEIDSPSQSTLVSTPSCTVDHTPPSPPPQRQIKRRKNADVRCIEEGNIWVYDRENT